jgi:hypothetical protein
MPAVSPGTGDGPITTIGPPHAFVHPRRRAGRVGERASGPTSGDHTMNALRKFHPDLHECELEVRVLPVITNLGVIVLTTGGYLLITPYTSGSPGGTAIPMSFSITGNSGISSMQPDSIAGIPGLATPAAAGSSGGVGATNTVGSGANDATAVSIPLVTRNTIANDLPVPPPHIGRPSGEVSPVLPTGQFYRGGVRETVPVPASSETPGGQTSRSPRQSLADATLVRPGGAPPRATFDVSGHSVKARADQSP